MQFIILGLFLIFIYFNLCYISQLNIYKKLQQEFITIREEEIKNTVIEIVQKQEHQKYLEKNLENFKHLIPN